jgi:hypothetical protein
VLYYYVPISCTHHPKIKLIGKYRLFIYTLTLSLICSSINFISLNMQVYHINYLMSCHLSLLNFFSKNSRSMSYHLMLCHLSTFKNNSKHSRRMRHHLMPCHISQLKNNSKNSKKSPHPTSLFSIEK